MPPPYQIAEAGSGSCPGQGITSLLPHRPVGKRPCWEHEKQRDPPGLVPRPGRQSSASFLHFPGAFTAHRAARNRDEGLWGVNTEGMGTGAPHIAPAARDALTSVPQLCHSFELSSLSSSHPLLCGAAWSILEQGRDSLPSAPPNLGTVPTLKSGLWPQILPKSDHNEHGTNPAGYI